MYKERAIIQTFNEVWVQLHGIQVKCPLHIVICRRTGAWNVAYFDVDAIISMASTATALRVTLRRRSMLKWLVPSSITAYVGFQQA